LIEPARASRSEPAVPPTPQLHGTKTAANPNRVFAIALYQGTTSQPAEKLDAPGISKRFVTGHDFSRAEKALNAVRL
jgi:hypothetical protein